ncbi:MAG TPA: AAA family ATPase, partial [Chloroflexota bacterium]|nr:AAA family ATPase [Chloroflexota bacterium]
MILLKRLQVENFKLLRRIDLTFQRQGAVLVEGLNESGKSTLFESVFYGLYGLPLVTEGRGRGNLESVIRYGADSMKVVLSVEVEDAELEIARSLKRGRSSQASLTVRRPGLPDEAVSGVQAVNARIVDELGGLDGDALLNSCFVEQKKLSKLEDLAPAQRKESLRRLLNLERLTELAAAFRITAQDERELADARDRLELARLSERLPGLGQIRAELDASSAGMAVAGVLSSEERESLQFEAADYFQDAPPTEGAAPWKRYSGALKAARAAEARARKRGLLLAGAAVLSLGVVAAFVVAGVSAALLGVAVSAVAALLSVRAYRSAESAAAEATAQAARLGIWRDMQLATAGELEGRRRRLEERVGVDGSNLVAEEWRREVERLSRRMQVRRKAAALVEGAMERIVRMVLPNTERNLGQILPLLTEGSYHEAR